MVLAGGCSLCTANESQVSSLHCVLPDMAVNGRSGATLHISEQTNAEVSGRFCCMHEEAKRMSVVYGKP